MGINGEKSTARLFFALWPDEPVRARLHAVARELVPPEARAVAVDAVHLTLLFIGSADAARRACLEQVADEIKTSKFTLTLDQAGFWRKPQILWLGCSVPPVPLLDLVGGLSAGAERCGVKIETRTGTALVARPRQQRVRRHVIRVWARAPDGCARTLEHREHCPIRGNTHSTESGKA